MSKKKNERENYVVASSAPFSASLFEKMTKNQRGAWTLIARREDLSLNRLKKLHPDYVFFPHWSYIIPEEITDRFECVCFHCADLPYGRGGSPLQNLIVRGYRESFITAFKMTKVLDAGPIYMKKAVSLEGLAEEIYLRLGRISYEMMFEMIETKPIPMPQKGKVVVFDRRRPDQSRVPEDISSIETLFDFIRMLDAEGYPHAFFHYGPFKIEMSRPALKSDGIEADIKIRLVGKDERQ